MYIPNVSIAWIIPKGIIRRASHGGMCNALLDPNKYNDSLAYCQWFRKESVDGRQRGRESGKICG